MRRGASGFPLWSVSPRNAERRQGRAVACGLFPQVAGLCAEVVQDITAEMCLRREAEAVGNFGEGEATVAQEAADVERRVARNPVGCRQSTHFLRDLGKILRRDAKLVGIVGDVAVAAVVATLQQLDELAHQLMVLRREAVEAVELGMEIKEIQYHRLHGIDEHLTVEMVLRRGKAAADGLEVLRTLPLLSLVQPHDGVVEQSQVALHAVVRLRRRHLDELLRDVDDAHAEVVALAQVLHQIAPSGDDHAVALLQAERLAVVCKGAEPARAVGMTQVGSERLVANPAQRVVDDDVLNAFHVLVKPLSQPSRHGRGCDSRWLRRCVGTGLSLILRGRRWCGQPSGCGCRHGLRA